MREPPDWDRYSDRQLQESIATNMFLAVGWLERISWWVTFAVAGSVGAMIGYQIKHEGWRSLFGGWL